MANGASGRSDTHSSSPSFVTGVNAATGRRAFRLKALDPTPYDPAKHHFQRFWDWYEPMVHNNQEYAPFEKFGYLKQYTAGEALEIVQAYTPGNDDYPKAIEELKTRFGDKEVTIYDHMEALLRLPGVKDVNGDVQTTFDTCERHIRCLVALGIPEESFGWVFTPLLLSKMPSPIRLEMTRLKNNSDTWSLKDVRELLRKELRAREMSRRTFGTQMQSKDEKGDQGGKKKVHHGYDHGTQKGGPHAAGARGNTTSALTVGTGKGKPEPLMSVL